ncbi:hypothetical protein Hypma_013910 [Hypsizygus marmoreus]|uniref:Transmembrane protein n=1 Tax=Hypsizygus marmoreus TaxID=39966 RepID=A0A369K618_HYPMA|nr:hypothetical protein Hypma_013910 [Hypsizygus marmoreus]
MMAADQLSDIFIASALLHFIDHRRDVLGRAHGDDKPTTSYAISSTKKRFLDMILLAIMAAFVIAGIVVGTVVVHSVSNPIVAFKVSAVLYHVYIAFYIVIILNVTLSAFFLWRSLSREVALAEHITRVILKHIVPLLIMRVLFKFCVDITTSVSSSLEINLDALGLVEAIVECITYAAVLYMSLSLARPVAPNPIGPKEEY